MYLIHMPEVLMQVLRQIMSNNDKSNLILRVIVALMIILRTLP